MQYLDHNLLARLGHIPLEARQPVVGSVTGRHKSLHRGTSVEFAEYRKYVPGDDTRRLDWKAYARSDRYYIKEFEADTNLRAYMVIDISGSMKFSSPQSTNSDASGNSKYATACRLATNLAYLAIGQGDAVGACFAGQGDERSAMKLFMPPSRRPARIMQLTHAMDEIEPEGKTNFCESIHELAERIPRRGLVVLFSDLYSDPAEFKDALTHLAFRKHDIAVFHFVDDFERSLNFNRPTRFVDLEGNDSILAEPAMIRAEYQRLMEQFLHETSKACSDFSIDYRVVSQESSWQDALTAFLMARAGRG
jgi:uncharacterized protein (DUF58 family)